MGSLVSSRDSLDLEMTTKSAVRERALCLVVGARRARCARHLLQRPTSHTPCYEGPVQCQHDFSEKLHFKVGCFQDQAIVPVSCIERNL